VMDPLWCAGIHLVKKGPRIGFGLYKAYVIGLENFDEVAHEGVFSLLVENRLRSISSHCPLLEYTSTHIYFSVSSFLTYFISRRSMDMLWLVGYRQGMHSRDFPHRTVNMSTSHFRLWTPAFAALA
jgi:hypothetical protein